MVTEEQSDICLNLKYFVNNQVGDARCSYNRAGKKLIAIETFGVTIINMLDQFIMILKRLFSKNITTIDIYIHIYTYI